MTDIFARYPELRGRPRAMAMGYSVSDDASHQSVVQAFGLRWRSDWPVPWFADAPDDGRAADVDIMRRDTLAPRSGGRRVNRGELFADGTRFSLDGATIDMFDGNRIEWVAPGLDAVPLPISSTVAAHVLAWRGLVPLHGSAVAFDGRAILIGGESGAGKSTLAHALVDRGGELVSDDLSVLSPVATGSIPLLIPGRPAIRLTERIGDDKEKPKRLAWPPRVDPDRPVPLAMLLVLGDTPIGSDPAAVTAALSAQLFRPTWMRALPERKLRTATLLHAAQRIAFATMPPATAARTVQPATRAAQAMALLDRHTAI